MSKPAPAWSLKRNTNQPPRYSQPKLSTQLLFTHIYLSCLMGHNKDTKVASAFLYAPRYFQNLPLSELESSHKLHTLSQVQAICKTSGDSSHSGSNMAATQGEKKSANESTTEVVSDTTD
jgi:hypothetical protein